MQITGDREWSPDFFNKVANIMDTRLLKDGIGVHFRYWRDRWHAWRMFEPAPEILPADPVGNLSDQLQRKRARLVADLERAQRIELTAREHTRAFRTCIKACDHALSVIEAHHATADQFRKIQDYRS